MELSVICQLHVRFYEGNAIVPLRISLIETIAHGGLFQYDSRAPSRVTSIGLAPVEGMPFQSPIWDPKRPSLHDSW